MISPNEFLSQVIDFSKYAKYLPEQKRRETSDETVFRSESMHIEKFPELAEEIREAFDFVYKGQVLPSMRGQQFAGTPIKLNPARIFNCSYAPVDHPKTFSETMFLLLSGCGVGYSVQRHHVAKLPKIKGVMPGPTTRYLITDSIEGWANSIYAIMKVYFEGRPKLRFDYRDIRKKGVRLVTSGGKAPGPEPLAKCLKLIEEILEVKEVGSQLSTLECHDILCIIADAVMAGGIRRAAMIALFSVDDHAMLTCKRGEYWEKHEYRGRANNSATVLRHLVSQQDFENLWQQVQTSGTGEPGIVFSNDREYGVNPCCVSGDTMVTTSTGQSTAATLVGSRFTAMLDSKTAESTGVGFWETGTKTVTRYQFSSGRELVLTADHRLKLESGQWAEAGNLQIGAAVQVSCNKEVVFDLTEGEAFARGYIIGSFMGDGNVAPSSRIGIKFWGPDADWHFADTYELMMQAGWMTSQQKKLTDTLAPFKQRTTVAGFKFAQSCGAVDQHGKKDLAAIGTWVGSFEYLRGLLQGLFDADGTVGKSTTKGRYVRLTSVSKGLLRNVQTTLTSFGINSKIYWCRQKAGVRKMPDGHGGLKEYYCQEVSELHISSENLPRFAGVINFRNPSKRETLLQLMATYKRKPNKDKFIDKLISKVVVGDVEVYDCTIPEFSAFSADGLVAHNCEISLRPYSFCNLTTVNVSNVSTQGELEDRVRMAARIGTIQAAYTDFHFLRPIWRENTEKDALIGVSMTGIAAGPVLDLDLKAAAQVVVEENVRMAELLGINRAARVTCVKPEGTASLKLGTSSGIHDYYSEYWIRTVRINKQEPLYAYLTAAVPGLLEDCCFKPNSTAILSVPQKAPATGITRDRSSALALLERINKFNLEWVHNGHIKGPNFNNVSATVSVRDTEWGEVGEWMWQNRSAFTGLSILPYDGGVYKQAPFQETSKEVYEKLRSLLPETMDLSSVLEEEDHTSVAQEAACAAGGCDLV